MTAQFIDIAGQKMVILPESEFRKLEELAEELEDVQLAERAAARAEAGEEYVPLELVDRIIGGESALTVWREYRELSQAELAARAGCSVSVIADMESGAAPGNPKTWRALTAALGVELEDIVPLD